MKILLTGKNGQVGFELQRSLAPLGEVVAVDSGDCNLADGAALRALVRSVVPDVIVNPAAYTAVDKSESEPGIAHAVNALAPAILGEEAERLGASVVHYSTDYVFDGSKHGPYLESDTASPAGVYGKTKLEGELGLRAATRRHIILRTCWVVGAHGNNFAKTMLRLARERDTLRVVNDQWGAPTSAALIADITAHLVARQKRDKDTFPYGLFHLSASGLTNWHEYACHVLNAAESAGIDLRAKASSVQAISSSDYPTAAKRPANSKLDTTLLQSTFGLRLPPWQHGLDLILQDILGRP